MGIDILGIDIMGVDISGIDIVALPRLVLPVRVSSANLELGENSHIYVLISLWFNVKKKSRRKRDHHESV